MTEILHLKPPRFNHAFPDGMGAVCSHTWLPPPRQVSHYRYPRRRRLHPACHPLTHAPLKLGATTTVQDSSFRKRLLTAPRSSNLEQAAEEVDVEFTVCQVPGIHRHCAWRRHRSLWRTQFIITLSSNQQRMQHRAPAPVRWLGSGTSKTGFRRHISTPRHDAHSPSPPQPRPWRPA